MGVVAALLQLAGLVAVVVGVWWLAPWLALVVAGMLAFAVGIVAEPRRRS